MKDLDEILDGEETVTVEVEEKAVEEPTGEEVKAEEAEAKPEEPKEESSPDPEIPQVPLSAVHGERDRRQAAERQLKELQEKLDQQNQKDPTSVFEDEKAFVSDMQSTLRAQMDHERYKTSEFYAAREFGVDELANKMKVFEELAQSNASLKAQVASAVSPYHEMADIVDKHQELEQLKDVDAMKAKLRAEIRKEVEAEIAKESSDKEKLRESIPESLTGDPSTGGLNSQSWGGPTPLDNIIGN